MKGSKITTSIQDVVSELIPVRKEFKTGLYNPEQARTIVGIYNVSCRAIGTQLQAEKWEAQKKFEKI